MTECKADRELNAEVAGRGISSETEARSGNSESIVSGSGGVTSGDSRGKVRLWI